MREIDDIIIHCTATRKKRHHTVEEIRRWHLQRGFDDIGYHYVIYIDGTIHVGRPLDIVGAHAYGHNQRSIGICYVGGLDRRGRPANTLNRAQERSLIALITILQSIFPQVALHGHNDYSEKECPCFNVHEWWAKHSQ
jgi:N-acetylmuramoyl-L-alanine amidase